MTVLEKASRGVGHHLFLAAPALVSIRHHPGVSTIVARLCWSLCDQVSHIRTLSAERQVGHGSWFLGYDIFKSGSHIVEDTSNSERFSLLH